MAPLFLDPVFAVQAVRRGNHLAVIADPQQDVGRVLDTAAQAPAVLAVTHGAAVVHARTGIELVVIVQHQPRNGFGIALDLHLELVGVGAGDEHDRRGIRRAVPLGLQGQHAVLDRGARGIEVLVVFPVQPDAEFAQVRLAVGLDFGQGQRDGLGDVLAGGLDPAVRGEFDRFQQGLAAQAGKSGLVGVVDAVPAAVRLLSGRISYYASV